MINPHRDRRRLVAGAQVVFSRCMTQPGSDEMVYRVLLEHATNSAKSSEQSAQSETNSASDLGGANASTINLTMNIYVPHLMTKNCQQSHDIMVDAQGMTLTDVLPSFQWNRAERPARTWRRLGQSTLQGKLSTWPGKNYSRPNPSILTPARSVNYLDLSKLGNEGETPNSDEIWVTVEDDNKFLTSDTETYSVATDKVSTMATFKGHVGSQILDNSGMLRR